MPREVRRALSTAVGITVSPSGAQHLKRRGGREEKGMRPLEKRRRGCEEFDAFSIHSTTSSPFVQHHPVARPELCLGGPRCSEVLVVGPRLSA